MLKSEQAWHIKLAPQSIKEIEKFTDLVCDSLYINDTYYGNILMALTSTFDLCLEVLPGASLKMSYNTDYQSVTINIEASSGEILPLFTGQVDLGDDERLAKVFLVQKLSDGCIVQGETVSIRFDISAMHNKVYDERMKHLHAYLSHSGIKITHQKDD